MKIYSGLVIGLTLALVSPGLAATETDVVHSILNDRRYVAPTRGEGFLDDLAQVVMNPVFTRFAFQTWGTSNPLTPASLEAATWRLDDFHPYTDGVYGNSELNRLPPTVQASLRLMHSRQRELTPEDVALSISPLTAESMHDQGQILSDQLLALDGKLNSADLAVTEMYELEARRARLYNIDQLLRDNENQIELTQKHRREAGLAANRAQTEQEHANADLEKARAGSLWCTYNYLPWACNWSISDTNEALREAADQLKFQNKEEARWSTEVERLVQVTRALKTDAQALNKQIMHSEAAHDTSMALRDRGLTKENRRTLLAQMAKLSAFVHADPRGLTASKELLDCARALHYQGWAGAEFPRHPLFSEEVDSALVPQPDIDLWVCPTEDNHAASVHIIQNGTEIFHSDIHRGATQNIDEIKIYDQHSELVEDHVWSKLASDEVKYGLDFKPDATSRPRTIYANISAAK